MSVFLTETVMSNMHFSRCLFSVILNEKLLYQKKNI